MGLRRLPAVLIGVGIALVLAALLVRRSARAFEAKALRAPGAVIALREVLGGDTRRRSWAPTVEFQVGDRKVRFTSSGSASPPDFAVGEEVEVLYLPEAPEEATIHSFWQQYLATVILGGVGFGFVLLGSIARVVDGAQHGRAKRGLKERRR